MGLIGRALELVFGSGGNVVRETAEVFRENAEKGAQREAKLRGEALAQFAGDFAATRRGLFDRIMDAVNRLPRPAMALGTIGLFGAAMVDPIWFSARMQGIALVPEPLWWLLGAIVSFYFGARHQSKNQQFQQQVAASLAMAPQVMSNLDALQDMAQTREANAAARTSAQGPSKTPALGPAPTGDLIAATPAVGSPAPQRLGPAAAQNLNTAPRRVPDIPPSAFPNNAALRDWALRQ